jgi:hypothetical protein
MKINRVRLWNCQFAQQILARLLDPRERTVFTQLPNQNQLSENDLRIIDRHWRAERRESESLIRCLRRTGWLLPGVQSERGAVLTESALDQLRRNAPTRRSRFWVALVSSVKPPTAFAQPTVNSTF